MSYYDLKDRSLLEKKSAVDSPKERVSNRELLNTVIKSKDTLYIYFKYASEYVVTLLLFLALLPFLSIISLLIKASSRGPVLFKQTRYGLKGEPFTVYKFRTMVNGAHTLQARYSKLNEMNGGKLFKSDDDPRVTKLGKILRKYSIDEMPQLINILRGEMTIIGPRPISTPLEEYEPEHLNRFSVKPGLGAIWQAYYRGDTDFEEWMKMDCRYVDNISLKLDLKLFLTIVRNVLTGNGAR